MKKTKPRIWLFRIQSEVDAVLQMGFGKSLWHVSKLDQCRLVRLKTWEERYGVRLLYILGCLLPWSWNKLPKHIQKKSREGKGLGTRIAVITSNAAEAHLKEQVERDYPDREQFGVLHDEQRDRILRILNSEELPSKPRKVLNYKTLNSFVENYTSRILAKKKAQSKASRELAKMPYRGNPWR